MIVTFTMNVATTALGPEKSDSLHRERMRGLDLARALALLGMLIVNYELVLGASGTGPEWLSMLTESLQGRAAGTFVVLAGIGASLGAASARRSGAVEQRRAARSTLLRRGLLLSLGGAAFLVIWPADILHFYGVWLALGAALLFASNTVLVGALFATLAVNIAFLNWGQFFAPWDLVDLSYRGLATPTGYLRNLFLDGWHPVFPWFALYLYGMLLGRLDLRDRALRRRLLQWALAVALAVHSLERLVDPPELLATGGLQLLSTASFPPTPAFIGAGAAIATLVILGALELSERVPGRGLRALERTGQLALTLYVAHVIVGLGILEELGRLEHQTLIFSTCWAFGFFAASVAFASLWTSRFRRGPLEAALRQLSGGKRRR